MCYTAYLKYSMIVLYVITEVLKPKFTTKPYSAELTRMLKLILIRWPDMSENETLKMYGEATLWTCSKWGTQLSAWLHCM